MADASERRVEVTGPDLSVAFSNRGARLLSWGLPRFPDKRGRAEELVRSAPGGPRPLDIETGDEVVDARLREALFKPSTESLVLVPPGSGTLRFAYAEGDLAAEKEITFPARGYLVSVRVSVRRAGQDVPARLLWGPGVGNPTPEERGVQGYQPAQAIAFRTGVELVPAAKLPPAGQVFEGVRWAGVESPVLRRALPAARRGGTRRGAAVQHAARGGRQVRSRRRSWPWISPDGPSPSSSTRDRRTTTSWPARGTAWPRPSPWGTGSDPIVVPLISLLRWVHGHVGNYGWSIIVLTVLINLVMAPFRHYSIANGLKMSKMAPEMKVIQERYRKVPLMDPKRQQMQEEMAALYAKHGMNMGTPDARGLPAPPPDHALPDRLLPGAHRLHRAPGRVLPVDPGPLPDRPAGT